jgi:hypothetical protein
MDGQVTRCSERQALKKMLRQETQKEVIRRTTTKRDLAATAPGMTLRTAIVHNSSSRATTTRVSENKRRTAFLPEPYMEIVEAIEMMSLAEASIVFREAS